MSRTYTSKALTFASSSGAVEAVAVSSLRDDRAIHWQNKKQISLFSDRKPADALDRALAAIGTRYGRGTPNVVAMQLEYRGTQ